MVKVNFLFMSCPFGGSHSPFACGTDADQTPYLAYGHVISFSKYCEIVATRHSFYAGQRPPDRCLVVVFHSEQELVLYFPILSPLMFQLYVPYSYASVTISQRQNPESISGVYLRYTFEAYV